MDRHSQARVSRSDAAIRLWDVATGSHRTLEGHTDAVFSVSFSPDSQVLASGSRDRTVRLWDVATGSHRTLRGHREWVRSVSFSPDGQTLASGGGGWSDDNDTTVRLWDVATGNHRTFEGHTNSVESVSFSPDGQTLASGGRDTTVRLWDVATGNHRTLRGHTSVVFSVSFSPDGQTLASGSTDGTARLWDVATDTLRRTFAGYTSGAYSISFSPDGQTLASGNYDGTILLWALTPTVAPITLTPGEFSNQTFTAGTPITPLILPQATGGTPPYTYTLDPLPDGLTFDAAAQQLGGTPTTVGTTDVTYTVTDATGTSATLTFTITIELNLDVNGDGKVDVLDLVWVAVSYQMRGDGLPADVNADGVVNVQDLVAVAEGVDAADVLPSKVAEEVALAAEAAAANLEGAAGAPMMGFNNRSEVASRATAYNNVAYRNVAAALTDVRVLAGSDVRLQKWMPILEELLQVLTEMKAIPEASALLPNYPNPFNPETWIPYHLATDAEVTLTIYDVRGSVVRELTLGHQPAGVYQSRAQAAYWDGKNAVGEPVASGVYFYTLTAGEFTATRKMLIQK